MSGWDNNQQDKHTEYKYIEILDQQDNNKFERSKSLKSLNFPNQSKENSKPNEIELEEIQLIKVTFSTYMSAIGNVTNPLVRYFKDKESALNKPEMLLNRMPTLNTFDIDQESFRISSKKS